MRGQMLISANRTTIVNIDNTTAIYLGDSGKIRVACANSANYAMAEYGTRISGEVAMEIIVERLKTQDIVYVPTEDEIRVRARNEAVKEKSSNGKKPTRRGGS